MGRGTAALIAACALGLGVLAGVLMPNACSWVVTGEPAPAGSTLSYMTAQNDGTVILRTDDGSIRTMRYDCR